MVHIKLCIEHEKGSSIEEKNISHITCKVKLIFKANDHIVYNEVLLFWRNTKDLREDSGVSRNFLRATEWF